MSKSLSLWKDETKVYKPTGPLVLTQQGLVLLFKELVIIAVFLKLIGTIDILVRACLLVSQIAIYLSS